MLDRLQAAGRQQPTPELHLRIDREARYALIATVMAAAAKAGVAKVGFVTDPAATPLDAAMSPRP